MSETPKFQNHLSAAQLAFLKANDFVFADYFAYRNFGYLWKHPPARALAREARKIGLKVAVCRGTVNAFYPIL
jgi:hypothetical protein